MTDVNYPLAGVRSYPGHIIFPAVLSQCIYTLRIIKQSFINRFHAGGIIFLKQPHLDTTKYTERYVLSKTKN